MTLVSPGYARFVEEHVRSLFAEGSGPLVDAIPRTRLSPISLTAEYIRINDIARMFGGAGGQGHRERVIELARQMDARSRRRRRWA